MSLRKFFSRKTKKPGKDNTTETTNTTPPTTSHPLGIKDELEHVFKKFDVNKDGKISSTELGLIMGSLGQKHSEEELKRMIKEVDVDGDGFIDLQEFIEMNTRDVDSNALLESLKEAFLVFDVDKNGSITADELKKVLRSLGEQCSIDECRKMIAGVDQDGDGMISFDEFKVMMMKESNQN
uniref:probable calcium-binding protein CML25 n=1 Tax=Erigeron canadensis TaxID=72917 RepID=UPI001CB9403E|nr:probable calcium-binding protein CML25 [Erigeron canadensis]